MVPPFSFECNAKRPGSRASGKSLFNCLVLSFLHRLKGCKLHLLLVWVHPCLGMAFFLNAQLAMLVGGPSGCHLPKSGPRYVQYLGWCKARNIVQNAHGNGSKIWVSWSTLLHPKLVKEKLLYSHPKTVVGASPFFLKPQNGFNFFLSKSSCNLLMQC